MTEFRRDPLIRRWVVTGLLQGERPEEVIPSLAKNPNDPCPFCEGNESRTPPETFALRKQGSAPNGPGWDVRVVPNRGTDLKAVDLAKRAEGGVYDLQNASGIHETIIEAPKHVVQFSHLDAGQIERIFRTFQARIEEHRKDPLLKGTLLFRNQGRGGPGVFDHVHSQIVSLPFVPKTVADELAGAKQYYDMKTRCIFCDMLAEETRAGKRGVFENSNFFAWCPFAPRFPFEVWIAPKEHRAEFARANPSTLRDLAAVVKNVLGRIERAVGQAPLTFVLHSAPLRLDGLEDSSYVGDAYHWHIEILPHAMPAGGFEWGGDFYLSPPTPETCAQILSRTPVENPEAQ